ncbi:type II toxin-antitoxin system Phd/YefM family antitoxin [Glycomyces harbinensis]|uniref:Antitoxin n=1 Tax=Glycomyces harbinensis TaxID=58114 RepID=A0A1G6Z556_9ACTN|nr:type II toxin-antitoxin system prevent-host-death family antitoxin [Glycomyces harbinensis]SDD97592.1 prevent-host-death family protein [Glycomyces harbinensis]
METITQRELRNNSAAIMDAVEHGQTFVITRNGVEVAEVRPRNRRRKLTTAELVEKLRRVPKLDYAEMRTEADEFFGENRLGDNDPWERR